MEYLRKFISQVRSRLLLVLVVDNLIFLTDWYLVEHVFHLDGIRLLIAIVVVPILSLTILPWLSTRYLTQPMKLVSEAILHIAPSAVEPVPAPDINSAHFGKELVANLTHQVYELATLANKAEHSKSNQHANDPQDNFIANSLPLPLLLLDSKATVIFANEAATKYLGLTAEDMAGKNVYGLMDLSFPSEQTLDTWLDEVKDTSVTAINTWERVKLSVSEQRPQRLFDLAAYYNKDNSNDIETMLVLFDHTKQYSQDDQAISFIALSVHELRTPLTLLRGYIEAFEDEFAGKLDPQMNDFMFKMSATAQQLSAFVNNILNVARVDEDQLVLQLHEEDWPTIVRSAANGLALRAKVRGITLEYSIAPNLPKVGVDQVSITEVINNLVDNAIKYSGKSTRIRITAAMNKEGYVETTVQDFGMGISSNLLPHLFTKFYRDHRNRAQVGGTGLGLYISKAIVTAHGGTISVESTPSKGSSFSFTLVPYEKLSDELRNSTNKEITRGAHGWIKNHSLYRR